VVKKPDHNKVHTDELLLIYRLVSSAMESLVVYRCPRSAAVHLEAAQRACARLAGAHERRNGTHASHER
jgi:hypothetical protein